jgi:hypothetical protein
LDEALDCHCIYSLALAALVVIVGFTQIKLDALQEPGPVETFLATQVKHLLVRRSSREGIPPAPTNLPASIEEGDKLYAIDCSMCHGPDGHTPTDSGRWMYPRASELTSPAVQRYSDRELFWIVNETHFSDKHCSRPLLHLEPQEGRVLTGAANETEIRAARELTPFVSSRARR